MRTAWFGIALTLACTGDADRDGLSNRDERAFGTEVRRADSDRDGLNDGDEVNEAGTDPLNPDSDYDGFEDGEEVDDGTDPLNPFEFPDYRWPDGRSREVGQDIRDWNEGSQAPDWQGRDQFGVSLNFDQLFGYVTILQVTAGSFCTACGSQATQAESVFAERRADGLFVIHIVVDDDTRDGSLSGDFAATWAERHGLSFPVVTSTEGAESLFNAGIYDGQVPLTVLLDRQHIVHGAWSGASGLESALDEVEPLIAQQPPTP